jgi:type I restriction enzyme M protein
LTRYNDIFNRLENIALIDKYKAYQALDDEWDVIKVDLEIIQTEGFESTKIVDPNMVMKKKNGKDQEVQDGWIGRIMPFDLVQETYLSEELTALKNKENILLEIVSEFEELLDSLSEEEKEEETVNEAKDGFINAVVIKEAKELKKELKENGDFEKDSYEFKILAVDKLISEDKKLKKEFKTEAAALHLKTKATIEELSNEKVYELLELKWVLPIVNTMNNLPKSIINELTNKVQILSEKYSTTYSDVANEISKAESTLSSLIGELEGNEFDMQGLKELKSLLNSED